MATSGTMVEMRIEQIKRDPDFMMRSALDKRTVAQYKDNLEVILAASPVEVYHVDGVYMLTDGFHRVAAASQSNMETIPTRVHEGSLDAAFAAACLANLQHGKPLTRSERKGAICQFIKLKVKQSNRAIAQEVGMSEITVRRYRRELEAAGEIKPQEEREGLDGKSRRSTATNVAVEPGATFVAPEPEPEPDPFQEWFDEHVLYGDSLEIMPTLERKFDLAIVDPPYGITSHGWDLTNRRELLVFTSRWLNQVLRLLKPTARLFVFWSRAYMFDLKPLYEAIEETYPLHYGGMLVWHFKNVQSMPDSRLRYKLSWEPIFYYYGLEAPELNFPRTEVTGVPWDGEEQGDFWEFAIPQSNYKEDKRIHPTQKPLGLYKRIIETATHVGDAVLDPFAGGGTTAHAALLTGRTSLSIEQEPEYIAAMETRLRPVWATLKGEGEQ